VDPLLIALLHHPDPDQRRQGVELARALGDEVVDTIATDLVDAHGMMWPPEPGWSAELLELLLWRAPASSWAANIRHLTLSCDDTDAVLPGVVAALPGLEGLDLSWSDVTDLTPITRLRSLRSLRLRGCPSLAGLEPLSSLPGLTDLDLSQTSPWDMEPLSALSSLQTLGLERLRAHGDLRRLPESIEVLWLSGTQLRERLPVGSRPIRTLSASSIEDLPAREDLPHLTAIHLDRGALAPLSDWPVRRLRLRAQPERGALERLGGLSWLQLEQGHHLRGHPPDLRVLDSHQSIGLPSAWPDGVMPSPRLLRVACLPSSHPFRHHWWEAARHWRARGCTWMLRSDRPPPIHARRILKMHKRFGFGLQEARQLLELLAQDQLLALTAQQAAHLQTMLRAVDINTTRSPWDGAL
jgi:hypothetical protein